MSTSRCTASNFFSATLLNWLLNFTISSFFWFAETLSFRAGRKQTVLLSQIDMI